MSDASVAQKIAPVVVMALLAAAIGAGVYLALQPDPVTEAAELYLSYLRDDKLDQAYDMLHPGAGTDRSGFTETLHTDELRRSEAFDWQRSVTYGDEGCAIGSVELPGGERNIRLFFRYDEDRWKLVEVLVFDHVVPEGPFECDRT